MKFASNQVIREYRRRVGVVVEPLDGFDQPARRSRRCPPRSAARSPRRRSDSRQCFEVFEAPRSAAPKHAAATVAKFDASDTIAQETCSLVQIGKGAAKGRKLILSDPGTIAGTSNEPARRDRPNRVGCTAGTRSPCFDSACQRNEHSRRKGSPLSRRLRRPTPPDEAGRTTFC